MDEYYYIDTSSESKINLLYQYGELKGNIKFLKDNHQLKMDQAIFEYFTILNKFKIELIQDMISKYEKKQSLPSNYLDNTRLNELFYQKNYGVLIMLDEFKFPNDKIDIFIYPDTYLLWNYHDLTFTLVRKPIKINLPQFLNQPILQILGKLK